MGNGRVLSAGNSGSAGRLLWVRAFGAALVLLVAGSVLLGMGSQRNAQKSLAQAPASSIPAAFGSVSSGSSSFVSSSSKSKPNVQALLSQLPMIFEPNQGQADSTVKFVAHGAGYSLLLDARGAALIMRSEHPASKGQDTSSTSVESLRMTLAGANPAATVVGGDPLPGKSNYFIGNDPQKWRTGIPQFAGVQYKNVYPGIDLVFYGNQGRLEYDFKIAPGADPSQAELQFDGASKVELSGGDLILTGDDNNVRLQAARISQRIGDREQPVEGHFVLRAANRVGFEIGAYDRSRELVIDPILIYSTYFGGGTESSPSIAVNGDGNIYLAGSTSSTLPSSPVASYQSTLKGTQNVFIVDINPNLSPGTQVLYLTYLGGSGTDTNVGLAVDAGGNAYVAGTTTSTNFPTVGGYLSAPEPGSTGTAHVFVSKLSGLDSLATPPTLAYSTYLSGNGTDVASGMTIDSNADVFVTGTTTSTDKGSTTDVFPASSLPAPYQLNPAGGSTIQFFVTKVNTASISTLSVPYSTYFGGGSPSNAIAQGGGIAVDTAGNIYFSGTTNFFNSQETLSGGTSGDFPILNAYQPCLDSPPPTTITYPVTCTQPTTTPFPTDAFVAKLNPAAAQTASSQLIFSTYFGGSGEDTGPAITIDTGAANIYLTGSTNSASGNSPGEFVLPISVAPFQMCLDTPVNPAAGTACPTIASPAPTDAYVARLTNITGATGSSTTVGLAYFSYLGGTGNDSGLAIAVDPAQGALITGATSSTDFPVSTAIGPIQSHLACATAGCSNAYFAHIFTSTQSGQNTIGSYVTYFGGNGTDRGTSITLDPSLNTYFAGDTTSTNLETENAVQPTLVGTKNAFAVKLRTESNLCILNCPAPVVSPPGGVVGAGTAVTVTFTVTNQGPDLATDITVTGRLFFTSAGGSSALFSSATAGSGTCSTPTSGIVSCVIPTLQSGSLATVVMVVTPGGVGTGSVQATVGNNNDTNTQNTASASFTATTFSSSISPASATVTAGGTAFYSVNVNASPGFGANVSLTCSSLPVGATCGFNPSTLIFNGSNNQSSALSVTTTARPPTTITSRKWRGPIYALWLMAPGMALLGLGGSKRRRNRRLAFLALSVLFALVVLQPACSHQKEQPVVSGTPAGTYPLIVTATSGSNSVPIGFTLTVQ
ncbi:MAG: SBBP repeat-containing protein [Candidatus Sulfotelmatobacter sp.]